MSAMNLLVLDKTLSSTFRSSLLLPDHEVLKELPKVLLDDGLQFFRVD